VSRHILPESQVHPAIRDKVSNLHRSIVDEVKTAVEQDDLVIVGMSQNPNPRRARRVLDAQKIPYRYLEYGSYLGPWRRRNALKMWSGWPTFPMIFVKGVLIGGVDDLEKLFASGELQTMLSAPRIPASTVSASP